MSQDRAISGETPRITSDQTPTSPPRPDDPILRSDAERSTHRRRRRRRTRRPTSQSSPSTVTSPTRGRVEAAAEQPLAPDASDDDRHRRRRRRRRRPKSVGLEQPNLPASSAEQSVATAQTSELQTSESETSESISSIAGASAQLVFPDEDEWSLDQALDPEPLPPPDKACVPNKANVTDAPRAGVMQSTRAASKTVPGTHAPVEKAEFGEAMVIDAEAHTEVPPRSQQSSPFAFQWTPSDVDGEYLLDFTASEEPCLAGSLRNVVSVHFGAARTPGDFDAGDLGVRAGALVLVESERGPVIGVASTGSMRRMTGKQLLRLIRLANENDQALKAKNIERQQEARACCLGLIRRHQLEMKLIRVEYLHGENKALFYFSAENRVDFRNLVRELARHLRIRVEMRQVGVRDESKITGGLGSCGRELCCSSWIDGFQPVSIRMAKDQGLVLNPSRVSGMCGRLKCCLAYEQRLYQEARKALPRVGQRVSTPQGDGVVHELDVPRHLVHVHAEDGTLSTFAATQITFDPAEHKPRR